MELLKQIETPYVDAQTLLTLLGKEYSKPREYILRLIKKGELIRLKNGFYLIAEKIRIGTKQLIPYEQVANRLYGPSYVSLEWALSFYGLIPERVYTVTSITLGRNKEFHTPVGDFSYTHVTEKSYCLGVTQKEAGDFIGGFLIASPEKSLADLVFKTCRARGKKELLEELIESRRIDPDRLRQLDKVLLAEIAEGYNTKKVHDLLDLVGLL